MAGNVKELTDDNFQAEVLNSNLPVLVDFWATWCQPCLMIAPTVEALATEYAGKVVVGKLDTDQHQRTASEYGISSIPALLIFKGGKIVDRFVGVTPKVKLATALNAQLG